MYFHINSLLYGIMMGHFYSFSSLLSCARCSMHPSTLSTQLSTYNPRHRSIVVWSRLVLVGGTGLKHGLCSLLYIKHDNALAYVHLSIPTKPRIRFGLRIPRLRVYMYIYPSVLYILIFINLSLEESWYISFLLSAVSLSNYYVFIIGKLSH